MSAAAPSDSRALQGDRVVRRYERYAMVPVQLLRSPEISSHAVRVFLLLDSYANWSTLEAFPAHARLAADMGVSVPTIRRALKELSDTGYVTALARNDARGMRVGTIYTLRDTPEVAHGASPEEGLPGTTPGVITGDHAGRSQVISQRDHLWHPISTSPEINTDNNSAQAHARAEAATTVVVQSAAPTQPASDTPSTPRPLTGQTAEDEAEVLRHLLQLAPDLPAASAQLLVRQAGEPQIRERLLWYEAERDARAAAKLPPIDSPGAWFRRSLEWPRPPASYRRRQQQLERARRREEQAAAARLAEEARAAQHAQHDAGRREIAERFLALPEAEREILDREIRAHLRTMPALQASQIPPLPDVLELKGLAPTLWRDRLALLLARETPAERAAGRPSP